jgi:hypothetical protein
MAHLGMESAALKTTQRSQTAGKARHCWKKPMTKATDPKAQLNRTRIRVAIFALTILAIATAIPMLLIEGVI